MEVQAPSQHVRGPINFLFSTTPPPRCSNRTSPSAASRCNRVFESPGSTRPQPQIFFPLHLQARPSRRRPTSTLLGLSCERSVWGGGIGWAEAGRPRAARPGFSARGEVEPRWYLPVRRTGQVAGLCWGLHAIGGCKLSFRVPKFSGSRSPFMWGVTEPEGGRVSTALRHAPLPTYCGHKQRPCRGRCARQLR